MISILGFRTPQPSYRRRAARGCNPIYPRRMACLNRYGMTIGCGMIGNLAVTRELSHGCESASTVAPSGRFLSPPRTNGGRAGN